MLEHVLSPLRNARTVLKHYKLSFDKTVVWSRMAQRIQTVNIPTLSSPAQGRSRTRRRTLLRSISGSRASTTCTAPSRHHRWDTLRRNGWVVDIAVHALHSCRESCGLPPSNVSQMFAVSDVLLSRIDESGVFAHHCTRSSYSASQPVPPWLTRCLDSRAHYRELVSALVLMFTY